MFFKGFVETNPVVFQHFIRISCADLNISGQTYCQFAACFVGWYSGNDFSVEEARETIRIINKFVLKVPLADDEIETILRDDAFKKPVFFMGSTFLFDKFATFLKNNHHIIKINNQLHIYKNGIYISGLAEIEAEMIKHIPQLNRSE